MSLLSNHTEVVDHGAACGDDVALLYVHVVAVARDDRVEHLRLLRVLLPQEGPLVAVPHLPARYNLACISKRSDYYDSSSVFSRRVLLATNFSNRKSRHENKCDRWQFGQRV